MSEDVMQQALAWRAAGKGVGIATVIATWGSSPRPVGSQLAVSEAGAMTGSVSGGCVEGAVVEQAQLAIADKKPRLLDFGISNEQAWEVGLACGGKLQVYVERVGREKAALFDRLLADRAAGLPAALVTDLGDGAQGIVHPDQAAGSLTLSSQALDAVRAALGRDRGGVIEVAGKRLFVQVVNPPLRLVLVGAVHIAQTLAPMAALAGYSVTVVDPRRSFATDARFPGVTLVAEWPDEAMTALKLDGRSAVVTLTHDPKLDDPALQVALRSPAFYIGCLGSKKTHAGRLRRLTEAGFGEADLARLHGPVGLNIGALTPAEIAVSIVAEITAVLHTAGGEKTTVAA
jgi:xanthine dehydrogenase accessory factor